MMAFLGDIADQDWDGGFATADRDLFAAARDEYLSRKPAATERERRESEVGRKAYLALAGHHGRHMGMGVLTTRYQECGPCQAYERLRAALAAQPDAPEAAPRVVVVNPARGDTR
jgi:hypothetical protein